ncbi:MAG TPA: tetratricopeptide repeat protein [Candidatus Polarisedimenticolia bacterium]|jgi:tetratricopeptide (TPR) repeat protein|nr:tetratricopeptide repeat protein [Candidatus Polarisedimenticolia bacterium]
MGRRLALLVLGIPGLLGFGALAAAQWRGADALTEYAELQKEYPPDSMKPPDPKIVARKQLVLARADRLVPDLPEVQYQRALLFTVMAETESLQPAAGSSGGAPSPSLVTLLREALWSINHAIQLNPCSAEYQFVKATIIQNLEANLSAERLEASGKAVAQLLTISDSLDPYKPQLHYRIGSFWLALGDITSAKRIFSTVLRQNPALSKDILTVLWSSVTSVSELRDFIQHEPRTCVILAEFLAERGFDSEAEHEYLDAAPGAPNSFQVLSALVRRYMNDGKTAAVLELVKTAEHVGRIKDPRERAALRYLAGQAYFREGRIQDAISAYEAALRIDDTQLHIHHALAMAYLRAGQYGKAIARWQFLKSRFGESRVSRDMNSVMHAGLAEAFEMQGRYVDALAEYLKAAELDPRNRVLSLKIEELSGRL